MKPPCMVMVSLVIPAVRVFVVKKLVEEYGLNQAEAAGRVQVTRAAVTQYLKGIRGGQPLEFILKSEVTQKLLLELSEELAKDKPNMVFALKKLCGVCMYLRKERILCKYCEEMMPAIRGSECNACLTLDS